MQNADNAQAKFKTKSPQELSLYALSPFKVHTNYFGIKIRLVFSIKTSDELQSF